MNPTAAAATSAGNDAGMTVAMTRLGDVLERTAPVVKKEIKVVVTC